MTSSPYPMPPLRQIFSRSRCGFLVLALSLSPLSANATTVIPPEFDALVQQAEYVVRGTVKSVVSELRTDNDQRRIITRVEIDVAEVIAGTPPSPLVLEMLGGRVGNQTMSVQGSPTFAVGDEHILFIRGNGVQFNPLVGLMYGQYPVAKDAGGARRITRSDGTPLRDEKDVALPMHDSDATVAPAATNARSAAPASTPALTPSEFANRIRASRQKATPSK